MTTEELSLKIDGAVVDLSGKIDGLATNVDNLAIIMANGFRGVDKRFDKVEDRLTRVEGKLTKVEGKVGILQEIVRQTRQDVLNLGDKFVSYKQFDHLSSRVSTLETRMA